VPSSSVRTFTDSDEYALTVRSPPNDGPGSMTVIGSGNFTGKLVRIDMHRLWMQRFYDNLPRIGHAANMVGRAKIMFRADGGSELFHNGQEMLTNSIKHYSHAGNYHWRTSGPISVLVPFRCCSAGCTWFGARRMREILLRPGQVGIDLTLLRRIVCVKVLVPRTALWRLLSDCSTRSDVEGGEGKFSREDPGRAFVN